MKRKKNNNKAIINQMDRILRIRSMIKISMLFQFLRKKDINSRSRLKERGRVPSKRIFEIGIRNSGEIFDAKRRFKLKLLRGRGGQYSVEVARRMWDPCVSGCRVGETDCRDWKIIIEFSADWRENRFKSFLAGKGRWVIRGSLYRWQNRKDNSSNSLFFLLRNERILFSYS